jgi:hypothetical protein
MTISSQIPTYSLFAAITTKRPGGMDIVGSSHPAPEQNQSASYPTGFWDLECPESYIHAPYAFTGSFTLSLPGVVVSTHLRFEVRTLGRKSYVVIEVLRVFPQYLQATGGTVS